MEFDVGASSKLAEFGNRWGYRNLSKAEQVLFSCFYQGHKAYINDPEGYAWPEDGVFYEEKAKNRPVRPTKENTISGRFLSCLCMEASTINWGRTKIDLSGAWIRDDFDLSHTKMDISLIIENSTFEKCPNLNFVRLRLLDFSGCWLKQGLKLSNTSADTVLLKQGF